VYVRKSTTWQLLTPLKAYQISASAESLWLISWRTVLPHKYDLHLKKFIQKGTTKALRITAGSKQTALMRGLVDDRLY